MTDYNRRADDERIVEILEKLNNLITASEVIKEQFQSHLQGCQRHFSIINEVIGKHGATLYGNGNPGHVVRLDRLEQVQESRTRQFMLIWGAIITTTVGTILSRFWGVLKGNG